MSSLAERLVRQYVRVTATILIGVILFAVGGVARIQFTRGVDAAARVAGAAATRMLEKTSAGTPFTIAAYEVVRDVNFPTFDIAIIDDHGRVVAGERRRETPLQRLFGLRETTVPIPGGAVTTSVDVPALRSEIDGYVLWFMPFAVLALLIALASARAFARSATEPLAEIRAGLAALAEGTHDPVPIRRETDVREIAEIGAAFNAAADAIRRAKEIEGQTEERMRQFVADSGHELRTPLTVILAYADVLEGSGERSAADRHALAAIRAESNRMRSLVDALILLARLERRALPAPTRPVNVTLLAEDVAERFAAVAAGRLTIAAEADHLVDADEAALAPALGAVVDNALRYAPDGPVVVSVARETANVVVAVRDRGPGFDAHDLPYVFERFFRGDHRPDGVSGSGLGLAIARVAIERAGGTIVAANHPDGGAVVRMTLPALGAPVP